MPYVQIGLFAHLKKERIMTTVDQFTQIMSDDFSSLSTTEMMVAEADIIRRLLPTPEIPDEEFAAIGIKNPDYIRIRIKNNHKTDSDARSPKHHRTFGSDVPPRSSQTL